ncbi:MAG: 4'-phosphopantetheinyl transferase superfamily protein [Nitrospira sp.]
MLISFQSIDHLTGTEFQNPIVLEPQAVHLWGIELEGSSRCIGRCLGWLDEAERHRAARFIREQDRQHYVLAHGGLRAILSRYLELSPRAVSLARTEAGKPVVARDTQEPSGITFNLSHSHNRALIAVSKAQEIGVDLESVRPDVEAAKLSERYFTPVEHTVIMQATEDQRALTFFRYWVAKEAALKAQGIGLRGLSDCEVILGPDAVSGKARARLESQSSSSLQLRLLSCGEGWEAAVAAKNLDVVRQGR